MAAALNATLSSSYQQMHQMYMMVSTFEAVIGCCSILTDADLQEVGPLSDGRQATRK
ncbi:hypothetical protein E4U43_003772 [Claviceps pusilla]|uniref:Uncharacterized protein n=1 Tax=Claviceps pusilla TaxID=123648 RepID=A0A9P7NGW5_9HYPO|nr:hypothetical protein E4U43_003772 [Claviceps pusilla]